MDSAFQWLSQLVAWFGQFVPRWEVIESTWAGCKFVRGSRVVPFGPGIVWYWPVTTTIQKYPTARQADDLRTQTIVTADDKVIAIGGMIVYEVDDIEKIVAHTYLPSQTVKEIALGAFHDVCCQQTWEMLTAMQRDGRLDKALKAETKKALEPYGVRVLRAMLTDLSPTKCIRLIQSTNVDG